MIFDSPGSDHAHPRNSGRLVCDGGFADFVHRSERRPVHRNPRPRDQDDPKEPENRPELVIPQSKRLRDQTVGV